MSSSTQAAFAKDAWQTPRNARTLRAYMALRNQEIGARIAELRQKRGNPPQEAVAARLGVSYRTYQTWESGEAKPSYRNLERLADFYGVSEDFILTGNPNGLPEPAAAQNGELAALETQMVEMDGKLNQILDLRTPVLDRINERLTRMEENQQVFVEAEGEVRQLMQELVGTAAALAGQVSSLEARLAVLGSELSRLSARGSASTGRRPATGG